MFLFYQFLKIFFKKYWYYLSNNNTDGNQSAFQVNVFVFVLIIGNIKCFVADSNAVLKRCLNRADQVRNTNAMKEMTGI